MMGCQRAQLLENRAPLLKRPNIAAIIHHIDAGHLAEHRDLLEPCRVGKVHEGVGPERWPNVAQSIIVQPAVVIERVGGGGGGTQQLDPEAIKQRARRILRLGELLLKMIVDPLCAITV